MRKEASLREKAYLHIQSQLLSGELAAGRVISEASLASQLGISRTPVREAIQQLEQEGVVQQVSRYGTVVRVCSHDDIVELYELREALEPYAVERATPRLSQEELALLESFVAEHKIVADELHRTGDPMTDQEGMKRILAADMAFHLVLLRAAGNRRLTDSVERMRVLGRIFAPPRPQQGLPILESAERIQEIHRQHAEILTQVRCKDAVAAREAMARHIRSSLETALGHARQAAEVRKFSAEVPLDGPIDRDPRGP